MWLVQMQNSSNKYANIWLTEYQTVGLPLKLKLLLQQWDTTEPYFLDCSHMYFGTCHIHSQGSNFILTLIKLAKLEGISSL